MQTILRSKLSLNIAWFKQRCKQTHVYNRNTNMPNENRCKNPRQLQSRFEQRNSLKKTYARAHQQKHTKKTHRCAKAWINARTCARTHIEKTARITNKHCTVHAKESVRPIPIRSKLRKEHAATNAIKILKTICRTMKTQTGTPQTNRSNTKNCANT